MEGSIKALFISILFALIEAATILEKTADKKQELLYGLISRDCWTELFVHKNLDPKCLKLVFAKLLGYGIVFSSAVVKLPQIFNIIKAKSTKGLAEIVLYMELLGYMIGMLYPMHYGQPFSAYGENVFVSVQSALVLCLLWYYNSHRYPLKIVVPIVLGYITFVLILYDGRLLSDATWSLLYAVLPQLMVFSRLIQIKENYKNKSTGTLSFIMYGLYLMGSVARVFTTMVEVGDKLMLANFLVAAVINGVLVLQILMYWKNKVPIKAD